MSHWRTPRADRAPWPTPLKWLFCVEIGTFAIIGALFLLCIMQG
jgi:hypothetical protein